MPEASLRRVEAIGCQATPGLEVVVVRSVRKDGWQFPSMEAHWWHYFCLVIKQAHLVIDESRENCHEVS